ncbi:MAG: hypothetical protein MUP55_03850 [Candidatus Aenigmarchaeota archaeon]|nr:hypothetical protein [Candidatus Aenigmarchaeota archaeon]
MPKKKQKKQSSPRLLSMSTMAPGIVNSDDYPLLGQVRERVMERVTHVENQVNNTPLMDRLLSAGIKTTKKKKS